MDNVIVTAKMIREARERREAQASEGAFNLSKARPLKELMAESRARKQAAAAAAAAAAPAPVAARAAPAASAPTFMSMKERNAEIKNKVKEAVIEAAKNARKVYDENKNKKTYYTGQIGINERDMIGKAQEAIRSAKSSKGGGTFISLTDNEFKKLVTKYYPEYY